jgi:methylmalonyl-CoA/ethylmalonyl-CoA epimerase
MEIVNMPLNQITTDPDPYEPFLLSQGIRVGDLLFISGQAGYGDDGQIVAGGFRAQGEQAFANLDRALVAGGSNLNNVAKVTIFLTDMSDFNEVVELRRKYFTAPYPADSIVEVSGLYTPAAKIEIEAIAIVPAAHRDTNPPLRDVAVPPKSRIQAPSQTASADIATVIGTDSLADPFLGNVIEIAIVTADAQRTMEGLCRMGIGPWQVHTFTPENTTNQTYRGNPSPFTMKVCFAPLGSIICELIEPIAGSTIFAEFLERHGEGIHHVAYDCNNIPLEQRIAEFERRGFQLVQSGSWMGTNSFAFFETEDATTTCFETYIFPDDWQYPAPDRWYPPQA